MNEKKDVLKEIEWKLKEIWREYREILEEGEDQYQAQRLLDEYKALHHVYRRQKVMLADLD